MRLLVRAGPVAMAVMLAPFSIFHAIGEPVTSGTRVHQTVALSPFERAERLREALEGRPEEQRTRRDYDHVLDAFRAIYHGDPASSKADASISAVADLLSEEGRIFQDEKQLHDAIGQYEFLRREYPASRFRFSALLTEAEIYRRDLNDRAAAKAAFQQFLKLYPQNALADQARQGLKQIRTEEAAERRSSPSGTISAEDAAAESGAPPRTKPLQAGKRKSRNTILTAAVQSQQPQPAAPKPPSASRRTPAKEPAENPDQDAEQTVNEPAATEPAPTAQTPPATAPQSETTAPPNANDVALNSPPPPRKGGLLLVTGVRHWSTPIYTRVAIDLQGEVEYEAARVPSPDRIFFDLHGARLAPELVGKSVVVIDDGFLKRIRVAQFSNEVTRVVLDVSDVSDYSAFLLPNPYRLIIDIHGRKGGALTETAQKTEPQPAPPASGTSSTATEKGSAPQTARPTRQDAQSPASAGNASSGKPTSSPDGSSRPPQAAANSGEPAAAVGDHQAQGATIRDIASLGRQPDKVKATRGPTTAPIAASVAGTTQAPQPSDTTTATKTSRTGKNQKAPGPAVAEAGASGIHEAEPTAEGGRSLSRALGLKIGRIVVDAGHGGHDSGTLGPDGIQEKDVVLDVALRLGKLLKQRLGADVIFTRDDDTFIPLETRTAIANKAQADLFISIHANSSQDETARGVETYYLNFTSSPEALEVAARENAVSQQSIHQLSELVKKIALQDKIDESREFASDVEKNLFDGLAKGNPGLRDRGVKKAPFVVLIGANMPSILAEISFLTNPDDAQELREPAYRQRIAESLYHGVARYVGGLSGVRLAESNPHTTGN